MSELGDLLELIHGGLEPRYATARGRLRTWRHHEGAGAALRAHARRSGGATYAPLGGGRAPEESTEEQRFWIRGDRVREEDSDGRYAVRRGELWWFWDPRTGARSNERDPSVGYSGLGAAAMAMLEPAGLLGELRFTPAGRSAEAVLARGVPRGAEELGPGALHHFGLGADVYELAFDSDRGVLLSSVALLDGQPFRRLELAELELDAEIEDGVFVFEPPPGEEVEESPHVRRLEWIPVTEAQRRAAFTVLVPERGPEEWSVRCMYSAGNERRGFPAVVLLHYRSDSAHQGVNISLHPARPDEYESQEGFETIGGVSVRVIGAQVHAYLEREGTFASLLSDTLTRDEVLAIARRLVPAPSESGL